MTEFQETPVSSTPLRSSDLGPTNKTLADAAQACVKALRGAVPGNEAPGRPVEPGVNVLLLNLALDAETGPSWTGE
jgi:K+-transporting ATPase c subunit